MANTTSVAPIKTEGNDLTLQGYTLGIADEASTWLSTELSSQSFKVPEGYDLKGEVSSAMVKLSGMTDKAGKPILSIVSRESVLMFLKDMTTQGLSFTRNQCYAIPYGNELKLQRSYFGTISALSNMFPGYEPTANVIYDGDTFDYGTDSLNGYNYIDNHVSSFLNRDNPIVGVYGSIIDKATGKRVYGAVMTRKEIDKSWNKARTKNVQEEFPTEMAKRTLINRMCKLFINSKPTGMTAMQFEAYNRTTENEYENKPSPVSTERPSGKGSAGFDKMAARAEEAKTEEIPF